jgi:A/G-specific adenine glycosylase
VTGDRRPSFLGHVAIVGAGYTDFSKNSGRSVGADIIGSGSRLRARSFSIKGDNRMARSERVRVDDRVWSVDDPEVAAVLDWWTANARDLPWRARRDVYGVWVSEVMSAQTTVIRSAEAWGRWMERWPTVEALADASLTDVLAQWQGLGYPRRARDLHRSARIVVESGWPENLTDLPGVGAYVAAAVRCFALEQPVLPLDVNVKRVLARRFSGGIDISGDPWRAGQAIMEFGQRICSVKPSCVVCPVREGCPGPGAPAQRPDIRRQQPFAGSLRQRRGRLLRQVIAEGAVAAADADREAAAGLAQDGLVVLADPWLLAPE